MLVYFCTVDGLICKSVLFVASCFSSIQFLLLFQHTFFFHNTLDVILETPFHFVSNYAPLVLPKYDVKLNTKTFRLWIICLLQYFLPIQVLVLSKYVWLPNVELWTNCLDPFFFSGHLQFHWTTCAMLPLCHTTKNNAPWAKFIWSQRK